MREYLDKSPLDHVHVAILGCGMSGLCMAIQLKRHGFDSFLAFEKADRVGGTWRENTYPGVACDVPSHLYSYSFAPNAEWSHMYSSGQEIQGYVEDCVEKFGISDRIRLNAEVMHVTYDENRWCVTFADKHQITANFVVSALGGLHIPSIPDFQNLEAYRGQFLHSAEWGEGLDLNGKRVGIIGTGASAVQILPEIVDNASKVVVFQRTPGWIVPQGDFEFSEKWKARFRRFPFLMRLYRWFIYSFMEVRGGFVKKGSRLNKWLESLARSYLEKSVRDPKLRERLTPTFEIGCKRVMVSDDYFTALQKPHVLLESEKIRQFDKFGVSTTNGTNHELDILISATGFKPFAVNHDVRIVGRDGIDLNEVWQERVEAHRTIMVHGFPNLFFLLGPNSGLGHNSVILMIEAQVKFVIRAMRSLQRRGMNRMEPRREALREFNRQLSLDLRRTVYGGGCNAWYTDSHDHNYTLWPHSTIRYFLSLGRIYRDEYLWEKI